MKKHKILLLLMVVILTFVGCKKSKENNTSKTNTDKDSSILQHSPLDGSSLDNPSKKNYVLGVMLDNHPSARPQSGFNKASIVYEFKVEGDLTRYLALFYNTEVGQIGPVRSARPYFVQTIAEYNGIYGHFGGSTLGMSTISDLKIDNLNGMDLEGTTYYRNSNVDKKAPHNAYTSTKLIEKAIKNKKYDTDREFKGFKFDLSGDIVDNQMKSGSDTSLIEIPTTPSYRVAFKYNDESKYNILRNNIEIIDEYDKEKVQATNIIIQFADSKVIGSGGILEIDHIGNGEGKLITNGKVIDINWEKNNSSSKTKFTTKEGKEITLLPGQTWIEVIDTNTNVSFK